MPKRQYSYALESLSSYDDHPPEWFFAGLAEDFEDAEQGMRKHERKSPDVKCRIHRRSSADFDKYNGTKRQYGYYWYRDYGWVRAGSPAHRQYAEKAGHPVK